MSKRIKMQEDLLDDEDDDALPGLDLSDSDDDASWTPFKGEKSSDTAVSRHKHIDSDDEDEVEYRSVVSTPKKPKKPNLQVSLFTFVYICLPFSKNSSFRKKYCPITVL